MRNLQFWRRRNFDENTTVLNYPFFKRAISEKEFNIKGEKRCQGYIVRRIFEILRNEVRNFPYLLKNPCDTTVFDFKIKSIVVILI